MRWPDPVVTDLMEVEKAWLACAIDGEGTICIFENRYPILAVYNTNRAFVEYAAKLISKALGIPKEVAGEPGRPFFKQVVHRHNQGKAAKAISTKPIYKVQLTGTKAQIILRQIRPYLIIKGEKADRGLAIPLKTWREHLAILNARIHSDAYKGRFRFE